MGPGLPNGLPGGLVAPTGLRGVEVREEPAVSVESVLGRIRPDSASDARGLSEARVRSVVSEPSALPARAPASGTRSIARGWDACLPEPPERTRLLDTDSLWAI